MPTCPVRPSGARKALCFAFALALFGAGCQDAPTPPPAPPSEAAFDVSKTTCPEIDAARAKVQAAYEASIQAAGDTYVQARELFRADLERCREGIWLGGPCDAQAKAADQAAKNAWGDISNDQFYKEWKKAKADWDECYAHRDEKYKEWEERNKAKERLCQEEFQAKADAAERAYYDARNAAKAKRDADMAFLDDLAKKCKEQPVKGDVGTAGNSGVTPPGQGAGVTPGGVTYKPNSRACQDFIPGEDAAPRQGPSGDFGPKDVLLTMVVQVAEDVTKTPLPTGAIDDKLFAGIVAVKIRTRITEMDKEALDHLDDNRYQRRYEQLRARYERALSVWGAIAAGKSPVAQVKKDVNAINAMPSGACRTDADCGVPVCCSARQVGTLRCDTASGACRPEKTDCQEPKVCGGSPAHCLERKQIDVIRYKGKFLPLDQMHVMQGEESCVDHYHALRGSVKATDGTVVPDPGPECGYGKVSETPTVQVMVDVD